MQKRTLRRLGKAFIAYLAVSFVTVTYGAVAGLARILRIAASAESSSQSDPISIEGLYSAVQQFVQYDTSLPETREEHLFALGAVGTLYGIVLIVGIGIWLVVWITRRFIAAHRARTV